MTWLLFILYAGDYTDRLKRFEFHSQYACEQVRDLVAKQGIKALCVADGQTAAYGSDVTIANPVPVEVKEWTGPIEGETP